MLKRLLLFCTLVFLLSCNNSNKDTETKDFTSKEETIEAPKELQLIMVFNTNKADNFKFLLNNIVTDEFQSKYIQVIEKIIPTSGHEKIVVKFGENNISNDFQINLGVNEVKEIEIESISLTYGKNSLLIKSEELINYFKFNQFLFQDEATFKLKTKEVNGKHWPQMALKPEYLKKLKAH